MKEFKNIKFYIPVLVIGAIFCACNTPTPTSPNSNAPTQNGDSCGNDVQFSPDSGMVSSKISLTWSSFGSSKQKYTVFFGTTQAYVDSIFNDHITVYIPNLDTGYYTIHVFIGTDSVRSSPKKFHVVYIPLNGITGIEVSISHLFGTFYHHPTFNYNGSYTIDSTGLQDFKFSISGKPRVNTTSKLIIADTLYTDDITRTFANVDIFAGKTVSAILDYYDQNLDPDVASTYHRYLSLNTVPNFTQNADDSFSSIVTGSQIANYVSLIGFDDFVYQFPSNNYYDGLKNITGYSNDAVMIITIRK